MVTPDSLRRFDGWLKDTVKHDSAELASDYRVWLDEPQAHNSIEDVCSLRNEKVNPTRAVHLRATCGPQVATALFSARRVDLFGITVSAKAELPHVLSHLLVRFDDEIRNIETWRARPVRWFQSIRKWIARALSYSLAALGILLIALTLMLALSWLSGESPDRSNSSLIGGHSDIASEPRDYTDLPRTLDSHDDSDASATPTDSEPRRNWIRTVLVWASVVVALLAAWLLGRYRPLTKLFPPVQFSIGDGGDRVQSLNTFRIAFLTTSAGAVVSLLIGAANWFV